MTRKHHWKVSFFFFFKDAKIECELENYTKLGEMIKI